MGNSLRSPVINLVAAVIIGASLIISASIVARRPQALAVTSAGASSSSPTVEGTPKTMPPIAQDSVSSQFREQVLAAPDVHTRKSGGKIYTLTDVKVRQVVYSAKEDYFTVKFDWVWNPPMARPDSDAAMLTNDGYNHYYGSATFGGMYEGGSLHSADVTIR